MAFLLALTAGAAGAQFRHVSYRAKMMTPEDYNGAFLFCRIVFRIPVWRCNGWASTIRADISRHSVSQS